MRDERKSEIKVGITVVVGLILFVWILSWAKNFSLSSNEQIINVKFENVAGLEQGDQVTVNGVRKGVVEDFNVESNYVIVKLSLEPGVNLREDAQFTINMLDLMGGKKVEIYPGDSDEPLNYKSLQTGRFNADIPSVMAMVGSVQEDLVSSIKYLRITLSSMNKYLTDDELNQNIKSSLSNLNEMTGKLITLIDNNSADIRQLTSNSVELTSEMKDFIKENKSGISGSIDDLRNVARKTDSLLTRVNSFADEIKERKNALGKLLYDDEMMNDLKISIKRLSELSKIILEQIQNDGINVDANIF